MSQALINHLSNVEWQYYCSFSFGSAFSEGWTPNKQNRLFSWLREVSKHHTGKRALSEWKWTVAPELGEMNQRFHYHALLTDLKHPTISHCEAMQWLWRDKMQVGWAIIRPYNPALRGVDYVLKCASAKAIRGLAGLSQEEIQSRLSGATQAPTLDIHEANNYEMGKYGKESESLDSRMDVMLSERLQSWLASSLDSNARRRAWWLDRQRRRVAHR